MVHTHTLQDGRQPAPIMRASLCTIKTPAAAQQRLPSATHWDGKSSQLQQTLRAMASEPGAQQSTAEHSMQAARPQVQRWADTTYNMGNTRYCYPSAQISDARLPQLTLEHWILGTNLVEDAP